MLQFFSAQRLVTEFLKSSSEEVLELVDRLIYIFRHVIRLDVRGARYLEKLFILGSGGHGKHFLGHVERIGLFACHHQKRHVDQFNLIARVLGHKVHQA